MGNALWLWIMSSTPGRKRGGVSSIWPFTWRQGQHFSNAWWLESCGVEWLEGFGVGDILAQQVAANGGGVLLQWWWGIQGSDSWQDNRSEAVIPGGDSEGQCLEWFGGLAQLSGCQQGGRTWIILRGFAKDPAAESPSTWQPLWPGDSCCGSVDRDPGEVWCPGSRPDSQWFWGFFRALISLFLLFVPLDWAIGMPLLFDIFQAIAEAVLYACFTCITPWLTWSLNS